MSRSDDLTTLHVRRAVAGQADAFEWLIRRFSGLLLAQANLRIPQALRVFLEPQDLVSEVWVSARDRLPVLVPREGRLTPVLVRYLSTMLLNRLNSHIRRELTARARSLPLPESTTSEDSVRVPVPGEERYPWAGLVAEELRGQVADAIADLDEIDRGVVILRGIEQRPVKEVAVVLGLKDNTVAVRYQRALIKLRSRIPNSVLDELDAG